MGIAVRSYPLGAVAMFHPCATAIFMSACLYNDTRRYADVIHVSNAHGTSQHVGRRKFRRQKKFDSVCQIQLYFYMPSQKRRERIALQITEDMRERLELRAAREERTISSVIRKILEHALTQKK